MGLSTGRITYNLNERGRTHIGQKRNFNVPAMMKIGNGEAMQEKIKAGDLVGYLGHGVRQEYGLVPPEVVLAGGKFVPIEPAFRTTYLKVHEDGTVEHEAQFLDTPLGKKAQEWFESKYGGFSSVVAPNERNPSDWYGFDYVATPNFATNRGYTLDSTDTPFDLNALTSKQKAMYFEGMMKENQAVMDAVISGSINGAQLIDRLVKSNSEMAMTIDSISSELLDVKDKLNEAQLQLDQQQEFSPMMRLSVDESENWIADSVNSFKDVKESQKGKYRREHGYSIGNVEFKGLSILG